MVVIPTVYHTGTNFMRKLIPEAKVFHVPELRAVSPIHRRNHLRLLHENSVIVPLRDPFEVARSWKTRGQNLNKMVSQWELLIEKVDPVKPYYLQLDREDLRDKQLGLINRGTGLSLETDWKPQGKTKRVKKDLSEQERELVRKMINDNKRFFSKYECQG